MARLTSILKLTVICTLLHSTAPQCLSDNDNEMINEQGRQELMQSQLQFSVDLLQAVGSLQSTDNVFFSPSSVYNALLLAYFTAANTTEDSLQKTLRIPAEKNKIDTLGAYMLERSNQKNRYFKGISHGYRLSNANRMYVSDEHKILPCIKKLFNEEIEAADFSKDVSTTVTRINNWVSKQTTNNIKDLLSPDSLNANTNLVMVNAAYFRGIWKYQFSPSQTRESEFKLSNGTSVPVMMMSIESKFSHRIEETLGAEVLELPYQGDDISMFIILPLNPSATAIKELLLQMNVDTLQDIVNKTYSTVGEVSITIPKFSVDQSLELTPILESLGVGDLFQSTADLSTLTGMAGLRVDSVIHKAKITVDEEGTEAAAATAIFANRFASDSFLANHPFVYFLFDKKSNILLFVGIFNSPGT